jgi:4-alpha-glucanotransferase
VRYPFEELLAVLLAVGREHGALLVAEDLGTVPDGFSEALQRRGLLGSRVLLFERDASGFLPAHRYPRRCLATANTHDLPPLAALEGDSDLRLRRRVGQLPDDAALARAQRERRADRRALRERLRRDGLLEPETADSGTGTGATGPGTPGPGTTGPTGPNGTDSDAFAAAVTAFLCATPACWVGISLDDLAGETEPINLPGVAPDRHPSWTRRMGRDLAGIFDSPRARRMLAAVPPARRAPGLRPRPA